MPRKAVILEWLLLAAAAAAFGAGILNFSENLALPGNEAEVFQSLDWTLVNSLTQYHQFPLWNPYINSGQPYLADPMTHVFNPLVTLPVLLLRVSSGFKLAVFLSFLAAAFGMWWLCAGLEIGSPARPFAALLYIFAGQPVARFFQGQYLFIFGFAWIPWCVGSLFWLAKTGQRRYIATGALSLALLFFSGNDYYTLYMAMAAVLFVLVMGPRFARQKPYAGVNFKLLGQLSVLAALALGVVAVQALPQIQLGPVLRKSTELAGAHTLGQIVLDLVSKDTLRPDAYKALPAREEFYAYIGMIPLLGLGLLPMASWKRSFRYTIYFAALLLLSVAWINLPRLPYSQLLLGNGLLQQFRHLLRILVYTSFSIILLAAMGLDGLWKVFLSIARREDVQLQNQDAGKAKTISRLGVVGIIALSLLMLAGVVDAYTTNRPYVTLQPRFAGGYTAMRWLRNHDPSTFYIQANPNNALYDAILSSNLLFAGAWYHFNEIRDVTSGARGRPVNTHPNYVVQVQGGQAPEAPHELIGAPGGYSVYRMTDSLPFSFILQDSDLSYEKAALGELKASEVITATPISFSPNALEFDVEGLEGQTLVVLVNNYPGWELSIDGQPVPLQSVSGYLAAQLLIGQHTYRFTFNSRPVVLGAVTSLISLGLALYLLFSDLRGALASSRKNWRASLDELRQLPSRLPRRIHGLANTWAARSNLTLKWCEERIHLPRRISLEAALFTLALLIYAFTRLYALDRFPIYFFADEAAQALYGQQLINQHFQDANGHILPVYVLAASQRWTPLLPMYFHALTLTLFGKSIWVTRGTSAVIGILGAIAVGLILKLIFKARYWWAGVLLLGLTPAWLLHSRTAFETVMTTAFYGCFLLCYLLYRTRSPRFIFPAIVFGAATFYTYSNAQAIMATAAGLLFLSDIRYHLKNWRIVLGGLLLIGVLAWPLVSFNLNEPQAIGQHLRTIDSYWYHNLPLQEKVWTFIQKYTYGLSPIYWFTPNTIDIPRHRFGNLGPMLIWVLPFVAVGLLLCMRNIRSSAYRTIILAALAVPTGAAMADVGITRVLAFVIPANILAGLGLSWLLERLKDRVRYSFVAISVFLILSAGSLLLLRTALVDGPLWFSDYGLYGMQYGAEQLFVDTIPAYLQEDPKVEILVSSTWANATDEFVEFFLTSEQQKQVRMDGVENYLFRKLPLDENMLFIMTPSEYQKAVESGKFKSVTVDRILPYPNGSPGFYFVRLAYVDNVDAIFAAEKEARKVLKVGQVTIDGQQVEVHYSLIDMGTPQLMFDGDMNTLMRGMEANPFILELVFPEPRSVSAVQADFGITDIDMTAKVYAPDSDQPAIYEVRHPRNPGETLVQMQFSQGPVQVSKIRFEIKNFTAGESANIHIFEMKLIP